MVSEMTDLRFGAPAPDNLFMFERCVLPVMQWDVHSIVRWRTDNKTEEFTSALRNDRSLVTGLGHFCHLSHSCQLSISSPRPDCIDTVSSRVHSLE